MTSSVEISGAAYRVDPAVEAEFQRLRAWNTRYAFALEAIAIQFTADEAPGSPEVISTAYDDMIKVARKALRRIP